MTDDPVDRLVRRAAERPVDVGRLQARVLARLREGQDDGLFGWLRGPALMVPVAFAALLAAIPVLIAGSPGDAAERLIAATALGAPMLADTDLSALLEGGE